MKWFFAILCLPVFSLISSPFKIAELPWIQAQDEQAIEYVEPFLPKNPVILEAGVCKAKDTRRMKEKWPKAILYGFEPLPKYFAHAKKRTKNLKDVHLYPYALYDQVGKKTFYRSSKIPKASSLLKDNLDHIEFPKDLAKNKENYQDKPIKVNCVTIDHWAKQHQVKKIDFIWLDTEGTELHILKNAKSILPNVRVISTEVNFKEFRKGMTQFPELFNFLTNQGFFLKYIWGRSDWQGVAIFVNKNLLEK